MASAAMTASFTLKLEDRITGPLGKLLKLLDRIALAGSGLKLPALDGAVEKLNQVGNAASQAGRAVGRIGETAQAAGRSIATMTIAAEGRLTRLATRMRTAFAPMGRLAHAGGEFGRSVGVVGAAGAGVALAAPMRAYADYNALLRQIAVVEGLSGAAVAKEVMRLDKAFRHDAIATRQTSHSIAEAALDLVSAGMPIKTALELLPVHSMAATAYRISPEALGQAVYALNVQFGIGHDEMGGALGAMALAAKSGKFNVADFSRYLPAVGGAMQLLGMTGREGANLAFAGIETTRLNTGDSSTAATNFADLLHYMTAPVAVRSFGGVGHVDPITRKLYEDGKLARIDLEKVYADARAQGVSPLMGFLNILRKQVKGQTPEQMGLTLGRYLHNQQAGDAAKAILQNWDHFMALMVKLKAVNIDTITRDFITMFDSPEAQLRLFGELASQFGRRLGEGVMPVLIEVNDGLRRLIQWLDKLDEKDRDLVNGIIEVVGWTVAIVGAIGTLSFIFIPFAAGVKVVIAAARLLAPVFATLGTGIGLAAVLVGAALYDIIAHWERFRDQFGLIWDGIKSIFQGIADVFMGFITIDGERIIKGLAEMFAGVVAIFAGIVGTIRQLFVDLWNAIASIPGASSLGIKPIGEDKPAPPDPGTGLMPGEKASLSPQAKVLIGLEPGLRAQLQYLHGLRIGVQQNGAGGAQPNTGPTTSRP